MKTRILHAEDDATVRGFLAQALGRFGYEVVSDADGEAALLRAKNEPFDIVITDHQMPRKDGFALVAALRAARFEGRIFVLAGALPAEARSQYLRLEVNGIAAKPISLAALRALLSDQTPESKVETVAFQSLLEATG